MSTNPSPPNFDWIAKPYRWLEYGSFGPLLERCRYYFLSDCTQARRALVLGDGDGRFTEQLLLANPAIQVDAVDASAAMLRELQQRSRSIGAGQRVRIIQADIRTWSPEPRGYDMVVSHFFLDCLLPLELEELVERVSASLAPQALWLISDFSIPEGGWRRPLARVLVRFLYFAFRVLTKLEVRQLPDYSHILAQRGFLRLRQKTFLGGLLITDLWQVPTGKR